MPLGLPSVPTVGGGLSGVASSAFRFVMSARGIALLAEEEAYKEYTHSAAEEVVRWARQVAPGVEYEYMKASGNKVYYANPRGVWHIVEYGSVNNRPYAPMRRSVEAAGLRFKAADKGSTDSTD